MSAHRYTEIRCDFVECARAYSDVGTAVDVRTQAARVGDQDGVWGIEARRDWCPEHRTRASRMLIAAPGTDERGRPQ